MVTTITVDESTLERFKQLKAELDDAQDAPDHTNESFLKGLMDTWEAAGDGYYDDGDPELHDDLERLKSAVETVEERTGAMQRQLEQMGAGR